jgi:hypothetical protein
MPIGTLRKIQPLHPQLIPPGEAKPAGITDDGQHQLYRMSRRMARAVPMLDKDGEREWKINRMTGERVLPRNKPEIYVENLLFFLESQGNGNVEMRQYVPMSDEEKRRRERAIQVEEQTPALIAALLDAGVTAETVKQWAQGGNAPTAETPAPPARPDADEPVEGEDGETELEPEVNAEGKPYPVMYGPGMWYLSAAHEAAVKAGAAEPFKGKGDEARAALDAAIADARAAKDEAASLPAF